MELKVRGSASQRGRSTFVPALRVEEELLSRKPRPGMSSWKVQGTFWKMLDSVWVLMGDAYLCCREDGVDIVVGHFENNRAPVISK